MGTAKKKNNLSFDVADIAGTFKPQVAQVKENIKSGVNNFVEGVKETAQAVGEEVPGVTNLGQSLKGYANMNNYAADQREAEERLAILEKEAPTYKQSDELTALKGQLQQIESERPEAFDNKYQQQIDALLDKITNREPFKYDFSTDPNWLAASEQYKRNALLSMENAMGEALGNSGGYGNSYAQQVGQQAYQQEISEMTAMIPEFAGQALDVWQANNSQMMSNLAALQSQQEADYSRYYNDWQLWNTDRNYMYQKVQDMSDDEFNRYITELQRWQIDRSFYADQKQIAIQNQQWQQQLNEQRRQFNQQMAFNYINMGVNAAVDLTTAGMSAGVQLAGIGVDAALGTAELAMKNKQFNDSLEYDYARLAQEQSQFDASSKASYDLAMAELAEERRQFDIKNGVGTQSVSTQSVGSPTKKKSEPTKKKSEPTETNYYDVDKSQLQGPLIPGSTLDSDLANAKSNVARAQALAIAFESGAIETDEELEAYKKKYGLR